MQPGRDPVVLGFVDFVSPAHAATAMDALQGVLAALIINFFTVVFWLLNICTFVFVSRQMSLLENYVPLIYIFILTCLHEKVIHLSFSCIICDVL